MDINNDRRCDSVMTDAAFVHYLRVEHGLTVLKIVGDGNCFFRAVAMALFNSEDQHILVRQIIAMYIRDHRLEFEGYAHQLLPYDMMLRETLREGTYSYEFQLIAASEAFGVNMCVYFPDGTISYYPFDRRHQRNVRLSFHNNVHYNLLMGVEEKAPAPEIHQLAPNFFMQPIAAWIWYCGGCNIFFLTQLYFFYFK